MGGVSVTALVSVLLSGAFFTFCPARRLRRLEIFVYDNDDIPLNTPRQGSYKHDGIRYKHDYSSEN